MFGIPTHLLAKVTVTETTSVVTLSVNPIVIAALSFTPRHLLVRVNGFATSAAEVALRFNGDSGSNYHRQMVRGQSTTAASGQFLAETSYKFGSFGTSLTTPSGGEALIADALSTRGLKNAVALTGYQGEGEVVSFQGRWDNTAAITSVTIINTGSGDFGAGSTFELCVVDESFNVDQDGDGEEILTGTGAFSYVTIPDSDGDLVHIANIRSGRDNAGDNLILFFNSDETATNYDAQFMVGNGSTFEAYHRDDAVIGYSPGNQSQAGCFGITVAVTQNYANASNDKNTEVLTGFIRSADDSAASSNSVLTPLSRRWGSTAAITSSQFESQQTDQSLVGSMVSTYVVPQNLIERQEITGSTSDPTVVTFSDIPQTYDHLELLIYARTDRDSQPLDYVYMEFNDDTTSANYPRQVLRAEATTVSAFVQDNDAVLTITGNTGTANAFGSGTVTIHNYTKTDRNTHRLSAGGHDIFFEFISSQWENTAAVTKIHLHNVAADDFQVGSVFMLRGINAPPGAATDIATINGITAANIEAVN